MSNKVKIRLGERRFLESDDSRVMTASGERKIFLFMMVSLDGYMEGPGHDLSWHNVDAEFNTFAIEQLDEVDTLLFGRRTYQLMENFWPKEEGLRDDPETAKRMNSLPKIVFSKTLKNVNETSHWKHIKLFHDNVGQEIKTLKSQPGKDMAVLGSNNLCITLLRLNLLDELRIMISPVVIGAGTPLFAGIENKLNLTLTSERTFKNGNILLTYHPVVHKI